MTSVLPKFLTPLTVPMAGGPMTVRVVLHKNRKYLLGSDVGKAMNKSPSKIYRRLHDSGAPIVDIDRETLRRLREKGTVGSRIRSMILIPIRDGKKVIFSDSNTRKNTTRKKKDDREAEPASMLDQANAATTELEDSMGDFFFKGCLERLAKAKKEQDSA